MGSVLAVLLALGFLHALYRTVESQWPTSYHALVSGAGYAISASPLRYSLFRFGPVFVASVFAAVSLGRAHQPVVAPIVVLAVIHIALTVGRAGVETARRRGPRTRALFAMYVVLGAGIMGSALLAVGLDGPLASTVPSLRAVADTLWTALIAAVAGAYLVHLSTTGHVDSSTALRDSRRGINSDLWKRVPELAANADADPNVVYAFMLVENLQRPRWFRFLERLWGRVASSGTYGILQVRSERPLSDLQSVEAALATHLRGARVPIVRRRSGDYEYDSEDWQHLKDVALSYNRDPDYAELVNEAYHWIRSERAMNEDDPIV